MNNLQPGDRVLIYGTDRQATFVEYTTHERFKGVWARVVLDCGASKAMLAEYLAIYKAPDGAFVVGDEVWVASRACVGRVARTKGLRGDTDTRLLVIFPDRSECWMPPEHLVLSTSSVGAI